MNQLGTGIFLMTGLDKLLTGNIQHPGFASAEEVIFSLIC